MQEIDIQQTTELAKGITDYGMMAVAAAFFLILTFLLWVACFKWFKKIINDMITSHGKTMGALLTETRKQNDMLTDISESLRPETQLRIKNISNTYFDLAVERVCRIIKRVREENHIADKEATDKKIRSLLLNMHDDRNTRFDCYTYRGKRISSYTAPEWVDWVEEVVIKEVYETQPNANREYTNVQAVYERIKLDFYHRLNK
jgi:hypothetical protein